LLETLSHYFKAGVENDELCVWVVPEPMTKNDVDAMRWAVPDVDRHLADGNIELVARDEWFSIERQSIFRKLSVGSAKNAAKRCRVASPGWA
jgi:hypothetical protein